MSRSEVIIRWVVRVLVMFFLAAHVIKWDIIQVDWMTLALLGVLLTVPFLEYVRKIKIGDLEAEISPREVAQARAKAGNDLPPPSNESDGKSEVYSTITDLVARDPQLGFAKLRIEVEKRLRALYEVSRNRTGEERTLSIGRLLDQLSRGGGISPSLAQSLHEVMTLAGRVVHGNYIEPKAAADLAALGTGLLEELQNVYTAKVATPVSSEVISREQVEKYRSSQYRLATIIPYVDEPRMNRYVLDQDALDVFLDGYSEIAEFAISLEPIGQEDAPPRRER